MKRMNRAREALGRIHAEFKWRQHSWRQKVGIKCSIWGAESVYLKERAVHLKRLVCGYNGNCRVGRQERGRFLD